MPTSQRRCRAVAQGNLTPPGGGGPRRHRPAGSSRAGGGRHGPPGNGPAGLPPGYRRWLYREPPGIEEPGRGGVDDPRGVGVKRFGTTQALDNVDLEVDAGRVLGLLGPNGAGKTTLVRVLTTLLKPDTGRAVVAGYDVVGQASALRSVIGLAGQYATVDELLTGRENLELVGLLYHLDRSDYRRRAQDALELLSAQPLPQRHRLTPTARRLGLVATSGLDGIAIPVATPNGTHIGGAEPWAPRRAGRARTARRSAQEPITRISG